MAKDERFEGIDRSVLDEDVWAEPPARTVTCPQCGAEAPAAAIRCARCNALLLMACTGSCGACASRTCVGAKRRG